MFLGYNTNGMAHHELFDAIRLLAAIGYGGVAITVDHGALPPYGRYGPHRMRRLQHLLNELGLHTVIETGARFLLDPLEKHEPTLISPSAQGRARRLDFYRYAIDCAAELQSDCVSLWSGVLREAMTRPEAMDHLVEGLRQVLAYAAARDVPVAFEPEPGMLIDTLGGYEELCTRLADPALRLTLDVGHVHCQGEGPIAAAIGRWGPQLANVHLEDMRAGVHEHLMFGAGEVDFPPIFAALATASYSSGVYVELSRHSHEAPAAARRAMEFLKEGMRDEG